MWYILFDLQIFTIILLIYVFKVNEIKRKLLKTTQDEYMK